VTRPFVSQVPSFRKNLKEGLPGLLKERTKSQRFRVGSWTVSLNFFKTLVLGPNGLFDLLRIVDQSSIYPTLPCQILQGKGGTHPT
jgi:hypothetical protein